MNNKKPEDGKVYQYAKRRFEETNEAEGKNHPMITSIRKKADERYLNLIKKYTSNETIKHQSFSSFQFNGIQPYHKLLYQADKYYYDIKDYFTSLKFRVNNEIIMYNIHLESYLNKRKEANQRLIIPKKQNVLIKHLITGLKALAMIKPDSPYILQASQNHFYPMKPMLYSTFISNLYHSFTQAIGYRQLTKKNKIIYGSLSLLLLGISYKRYQVYKINDKETIQHEEMTYDIIRNPLNYKKLFDIFSPQEDQMYMKYYQNELKENSTVNPYNRKKSTIGYTLLKLLPPLGILIHTIKSKSLKRHLIPKMGLSFIVTNELLNHYGIINRMIRNKVLLDPKLQLYKENLVNAYISK